MSAPRRARRGSWALTVRRRLVLAMFVSGPVAYFYAVWAWTNVYVAAAGLYTGEGATCESNWQTQLTSCVARSSIFVMIVVVLVTAVVLAVTFVLARAVLAPVRGMAETVERLGPTSLGLRLRRDGPRDETRRLADAIDAMLDRVAEGYEAQRRFAANASHELRTPLATQRALIEVSLGSALTAEQLELVSRQLLATNERNERLVDGLLTLAETDRGLAARKPQRLDEIAADVVTVFEAHGDPVKITAELTPVTVAGEHALLDRLVTNVVGNAVKYNEDGGWVSVAFDAAGTLSVANTGPVVRPDQVAGLFEPFHRLHGERLDHSGGVGLGLTIARSIVAAHDGQITAYPRDGGGLVLTISLPLAHG